MARGRQINIVFKSLRIGALADGVIEGKDKPATGQTIRPARYGQCMIARRRSALGAKLEGGLTSRGQIPAGTQDRRARHQDRASTSSSTT